MKERRPASARGTIFGPSGSNFVPQGDNFGTPADNFGTPPGANFNQRLAGPTFRWQDRADCLLQFLTVDPSLLDPIGTQVVLPVSDVHRCKHSDLG